MPEFADISNNTPQGDISKLETPKTDEVAKTSNELELENKSPTVMGDMVGATCEIAPSSDKDNQGDGSVNRPIVEPMSTDMGNEIQNSEEAFESNTHEGGKTPNDEEDMLSKVNKEDKGKESESPINKVVEPAQRKKGTSGTYDRKPVYHCSEILATEVADSLKPGSDGCIQLCFDDQQYFDPKTSDDGMMDIMMETGCYNFYDKFGHLPIVDNKLVWPSGLNLAIFASVKDADLHRSPVFDERGLCLARQSQVSRPVSTKITIFLPDGLADGADESMIADAEKRFKWERSEILVLVVNLVNAQGKSPKVCASHAKAKHILAIRNIRHSRWGNLQRNPLLRRMVASTECSRKSTSEVSIPISGNRVDFEMEIACSTECRDEEGLTHKYFRLEARIMEHVEYAMNESSRAERLSMERLSDLSCNDKETDWSRFNASIVKTMSSLQFLVREAPRQTKRRKTTDEQTEETSSSKKIKKKKGMVSAVEMEETTVKTRLCNGLPTMIITFPGGLTFKNNRCCAMARDKAIEAVNNWFDGTQK